jgi:hypothetical protein
MLELRFVRMTSILTTSPAAYGNNPLMRVPTLVAGRDTFLILAKRGGLTHPDGFAYFRKLAAAIDTGLTWVDAHTDVDRESFDYNDIATICMWQHAQHYKLVQGLDAHRRVAARVTRFSERASVAATTPETSLAEAAACGWKPA